MIVQHITSFDTEPLMKSIMMVYCQIILSSLQLVRLFEHLTARELVSVWGEVVKSKACRMAVYSLRLANLSTVINVSTLLSISYIRTQLICTIATFNLPCKPTHVLEAIIQ